MTRFRLLVLVSVCLLVLFLLKVALARDVTRRNVEIFTEMVYSQAAESFASRAELPGGCTLQPLAEGTVIRGQHRFPYAATEEDALRCGEELQNPYQADDEEALARGAKVYSIFCTVCHGPDGQGRGPVVLRGMIPPPSFLAIRAREMKDGQMFHVVTCGQGNMPSYAAQVSTEERWKAILHIRRIQESQP